ncbi:hypothetical protein QL285_054595 [Trifolium repens]|nr:hypothetical protein QL285_054595 [Trifolium repens]
MLPRSRQHCIQPHWPFGCEIDGPRFPVVAEDCRSILFVKCSDGGGRRVKRERLENQLPSVWLGYMPFFIHDQCCPAGFGLLVNVLAPCFMLMGDSSISILQIEKPLSGILLGYGHMAAVMRQSKAEIAE